MGQIRHGLNYLFEPLAAQLIEQQGKDYGDTETYGYSQQAQAQSVVDRSPEPVVREKGYEMLEPDEVVFKQRYGYAVVP